MNRIETILVPIDFAPPSEHALAFAVDLAEQIGATVHVITTFQPPIASFPDGVYVATADMAQRLVDNSQVDLDKACAKFEDRNVTITSHVEQGDAREVVLRVARERRTGLIVMGTHGRKGIARALIGSVTESVVRAAEVPVLTVH